MSQRLLTLLLLICACQSVAGIFLMWRTTRSPKLPQEEENQPNLLKRETLFPALKREQNIFNDDIYVDPSDFGIKFGRKRRSSADLVEDKQFGGEELTFDPYNFGISFGKRSLKPSAKWLRNRN